MMILSASVLAQLYLFLRIWLTVRSSPRSASFKSWTMVTVGVAILVLFSLNAYIMSNPIPWVEPPRAAEVFLLYPAAVWSFGSIFSALLLFLVQVLGWIRQIAVRISCGPVSQDSSIGVDQHRRRLLQTGGWGLAAAPLLLAGYGAAYAGKTYEVKELALPFGHPLRVVQLSDIHAGLYMTRREIRRLVDQVAALQPDLFVLTGDYITNSIQFLPECVEEMARIRPVYGTFAIMGNHESWLGRPSEIMELFRKHRITLLLNTHHVIQTQAGYFAVAGIDDLKAGHPNLEAALLGLDSAIPTILLSHRPEIFPLAAAHRIPLTLAGHYHGGQIKLSLPGGEFSPAHLLTPYPEGLFRIKACHLYVSRGIGTTFTPVRLNARPEITLLHLS
jgi:hypothetical protein